MEMLTVLKMLTYVIRATLTSDSTVSHDRRQCKRSDSSARLFTLLGPRLESAAVNLNADFTLSLVHHFSQATGVSCLLFLTGSLVLSFAFAIVALDLDTEHFFGSKLPKGLRAVPSLGSVRKRVVGNIVIVRVEGIRSTVRIAGSASPSISSVSDQLHLITNLPPVVSEIPVNDEVRPAKFLEISSLFEQDTSVGFNHRMYREYLP